MKLSALETQLVSLGFKAKIYKINNKATKQDRLYVTLNDSYDTWFIEHDGNFFMNIYIKRPKDFDFTQKQTEEEKEVCKTAKFILLNELSNTHGLKGIELYADAKDVLLYPMVSKKTHITIMK